MLDSVVLDSAVQQSASAIYTHIPPLFWISFPFRLPQSIEFSVLYSRFSLVIYFTHSKIDTRAYHVYKAFLGDSVVKNLPAI